MKRFLGIFLLIILLLQGVGCSHYENKLTIVAVTYADYEFTKQIVGTESEIEIKCILDSGEDAHSYNYTFTDRVLLENAKMVVYSGGESTSWIDDIIKNKQIYSVNYSTFLDKLHSEEVHEEHMHAHEHTFDEHFYLSIKNVVKIVEKIKDKVILLDSKNAQKYQENFENYTLKLQELDCEYTNAFLGQEKKVILADRHPFLYLFNDYNILCYSAFSGCSSEVNATLEVIISLSQKVKELNAKSIYITESGDIQVANTIISSSNVNGVNVKVLNSMQSEKVKDNKSYLQIMKSNLEILKSE